MRKARRDADEGLPSQQDAAGWTVGAWVQHFIDTSPRLRPRTRDGYESLLSNQITPHIGNVRLGKLRPEQIDRWLIAIAKGGQSEQSCLHAFSLLRRAYVVAMRRRVIAVSPCAQVDPPRPSPRPPSFFTADEARAVLKAARSRRNGVRWGLAFELGLRPGEARGLLLDDVASGSATLLVARALQRQRGKGMVFVPPKNAMSIRTMVLSPMLAKWLEEHLRERRKDELRAGHVWHEPIPGLLFVGRDGRPWSAELDRADWKALLAEAGVTYRRPYDARHTFGSIMGAVGAAPKTTMEAMGHTQLTTTLGIYTHVMDGSRQQASDAVAAVLWQRPKVVKKKATGGGRGGRTAPTSAPSRRRGPDA